MASNIFKIDFDITNYKDILPDWREYVKHDEIVNLEEHSKGNIDNCIWKKHIPSVAEINSPEFRQRENKRILKTGVFICIKEEICWIPPNYYFALQYCPAGSVDMQFRLKRLKQVYEKIRARKNPGCIGQLIMKSRGDGETTMQMTDGFWECLDGNMETGQIGVQSKTLGDGKNPCWSYVQNLWQNLPKWIKKDLCSDFDSGNNIAEKMKWMREADEEKNQRGRNVLFTYYPSGTPMDGKHDMKMCFLDEVAKWEECSFYDTFTNYKKFIMPGTERRGLFMMFSTPADKPCKSNEEVYSLWMDSNTNEINPATGTTKSRIHRYYSNPLEGIAGEYDKFGDADPDKIYNHIMQERKNTRKDKLFGEIRGYPLNETEMFESADTGRFWDNTEGLKQRKIYLFNRRFKSEVTKEPIRVFGNLEWKEGIVDNPSGVHFRQSDKTEFDLEEGRFAITELPQYTLPVVDIFSCPDDSQFVNGCDPFGKRHPTKKPSNGGGVVYKYLDFTGNGNKNYPVALYNNRPYHENIYFEDMLKACIFYRCPLQFENNHDKIGNYFVDRGYKNYVLPTIGEKKGTDKLGDAVTAKGMFMDEMVRLLNAETNLPIGNEPYLLENYWFIEIIEDLLRFNLKDTHENDISMSLGQALMGKAKLLFRKPKKSNPEFNNAAISYWN